MFGGLVDQAQSAVNKSVDRVIGQAAVALPLLIATGFLTTAGLIELIAIFGAVKACLIAAVIFLVIALITAFFATDTLADVEALVTGEPSAIEQPVSAQASITDDFAKLVGSDPMMALSAATTGIGFFKSFSRRTQVTMAVAVLLLVLAVAYLARRKPVGDETSGAAGTPETPATADIMAAAA